MKRWWGIRYLRWLGLKWQHWQVYGGYVNLEMMNHCEDVRRGRA